jgi:hypothetical protein
MASIRYFMIVLSVVAFGCASRGEDDQVATGLTEAKAIDIAASAMSKKFPDTFAECKPYEAKLADGVWHVRGTLPEGVLGGTPEARVRDADGVVIEVFHTQ